MAATVDERFLSSLAEAGFVIIASEGCTKGYVPAKLSQNQIEGIRWLRKNKDYNVTWSGSLFCFLRQERS